jgi:pantothenate kinase type III
MVEGIVGFDVGNSTVKSGWLGPQGVSGLRTARHDSAEAIETFLDLIVRERPNGEAFIATVNKPASDRLQTALEQRSIRVPHVFKSDGSLFDAGYLASGVDTP